jgi:3-phosphoglycerate kinase
MFRTLDEVDVKGKRVLVRVDLNVPVENGRVSDTTRIKRAAPTISEIADKGGKVILLSHFGRPKGVPQAVCTGDRQRSQAAGRVRGGLRRGPSGSRGRGHEAG